MRQELKEELKIPAGTIITLENGIFVVKGKKGEVKRSLHNPKVISKVEGNTVIFHSPNATKREKKLIKSYLAHLKNMIKGANEGFVYKLKLCTSHFPMTVAVKGNVFEIKNFIGESVPRTLAIPVGVSIKSDGQVITVEGLDNETVSMTAALIEKTTKRPGFDKRIFQDGIFITDKDGESMRD